ncbi:MAG: hypothetical protein D6785_13045, partial [Planctomycetota bacterium]
TQSLLGQSHPSSPTSGFELIALDALTVEGSRVSLEAKVFSRGSSYTDPGVAGKKVIFTLDGKIVGSGITNEYGLAKVEVPAGKGIRNYEAYVVENGRPLKSRGTLYALNPNKPIIITDVDHTIARTPRADLTRVNNAKIEVIPGSREMLSGLAKEYQVVYISGRYDRTFKLTKEWIRSKGFPRGPVLLSPALNSNHGIVKDFKSLAVSRIKKLFRKVPFALGDRAFDMHAYAKNGVQPVLIGDNPKGELPPNTIRLGEWKNLPLEPLLRGENPFRPNRWKRYREAVLRETRGFRDHVTKSLEEMPANVRMAIMVTFLTRLAEALEKGDSKSIEAFFDEITDLGFYKAFGMFYAGKITSNYIYSRVYEKYIMKYIKPRVLRGLLKPNLQTTLILALPMLLTGNPNTKQFVIDMTIFNVSLQLVDATLAGLQSALKLKRLENLFAAGGRLARFGRFVPGGWVFETLKVTVVMYFSNKASQWIQKKLKDREVKKEVARLESELLKVLKDPNATEKDKQKALKELEDGYNFYRNYLLADLQRLDQEFWGEKVSHFGKRAKKLNMALAKFARLLEEDPQRYQSLVPFMKRSERELKRFLEKDWEKEVREYLEERKEKLSEVYQKSKSSGPFWTRNMATIWAASGGEPHALGDPYSGREDILAKLGRAWVLHSFRSSLDNLPENRLDTYRAEREFLQLAMALARDGQDRKMLQNSLANLRKMESLDRSLYMTMEHKSTSPGCLERLKKSLGN